MDSSVNSPFPDSRQATAALVYICSLKLVKDEKWKTNLPGKLWVWDCSCRGEKRPRKTENLLKLFDGNSVCMKKVPEEKLEIFVQKSLKWIKTTRNCEIICRWISYWFCLRSAGRHVGCSAFCQFVDLILFWLNIKLICQKLTDRFNGRMNKRHEITDGLMCSQSEVYIQQFWSSGPVLPDRTGLFFPEGSALQNIKLIQVFFLWSSFWFKYLISV